MAGTQHPVGIEQRVYMERVRIFFRHTAGSLVRAFLAMVFISISLHFAAVPSAHIAIWSAIFAAVTGAIITVEKRFQRAELTLENASLWMRWRIVTGIMLGLLLGAGPFLLPAEGAIIAQLMIFVILITGVGVMCIGYTTMPAYSIGMAVACMGLLTLSFLRAPDSIHVTLAVMAAIATLLLTRKARDVSRTAIEGIRINEQLKDEVGKREAAEQDADRARQEAERANAAKSNFLANMSHELRTPMNAVIGFTGALKSGVGGPLSDKQSEYLDDIQRSGEHLLSLINDLLDLARIEAGQLRVREEEFDLGEEIEHCMRLLRHQADDSGLLLSVEMPDRMPRLRADRRLVGQMIVNLLSNAVKFTPGGGRVSVKAANGAAGIAVSVVDTGCGMTPDDISIAMLPYGQTDSGTTVQGTGLGLPLAREMAELHGGNLTIESSPGEGTTATISFPPERIVK